MCHCHLYFSVFTIFKEGCAPFVKSPTQVAALHCSLMQFIIMDHFTQLCTLSLFGSPWNTGLVVFLFSIIASNNCKQAAAAVAFLSFEYLSCYCIGCQRRQCTALHCTVLRVCCTLLRDTDGRSSQDPVIIMSPIISNHADRPREQSQTTNRRWLTSVWGWSGSALHESRIRCCMVRTFLGVRKGSYGFNLNYYCTDNDIAWL